MKRLSGFGPSKRFGASLARGLALLVALAAAVPLPARAAVEPAWGSAPPEQAAEAIAAGEFGRLTDVHLLQYRADPAWHRAWAAGRYHKTGILWETGSLTGRELYSASAIAVNLPVTAPAGLRFDRRTFSDGRFARERMRLEAHAYAGESIAPVVAGWITPGKADTDLGLGLHLGAPGAENHARVLVMADRWLHNQKRRNDRVYARGPARLAADGHYARGPWRAAGEVDWGFGYRYDDVVDVGAVGLAAAPTPYAARGAERSGQGQLAFVGSGVELGADLRAAATRFARTGPAAVPEAWDAALTRDWFLGQLYAEAVTGAWIGRASLGGAWQRDRFGFAGGARGRYVSRALLPGVEVGRRLGPADELRAGYLGNVARMARAGDAGLPAALAPRDEAFYGDKVHLRWRHAFAPGALTEFLISHEIADGVFGGFAAKLMLAL